MQELCQRKEGNMESSVVSTENHFCRQMLVRRQRRKGLRSGNVVPRWFVWTSICWLISCNIWWNNNSVSSSLPSSSCGSSAFVVYSNAFACAIDVKQRSDNEIIDESRIRGGRQSQTTALKKVEAEKLPLNEILYKAGKRGLGGGIPGAIAGMIQVVTLMWIRTIVSYQCRYGMSFSQALTVLLNDGGIRRLYRGMTFALIQAPLARFVSTASNDGMQSLLSHLAWTKDWGPGRTTFVASFVVGLGRILLMPIDTMKTVLQVDSAEGFRSLMRRVRGGRISVLYEGACANAVSAIVGHYPWFFTYNWLSSSVFMEKVFRTELLKNASIGIIASMISDTVVNAIRVIKTTKQSLGSKHSATYTETVTIILAADGWKGLFGRGLKTRIFGNALQSLLFTVVWRGLANRIHAKHEDDESKDSEKVKRR